MSDLPDRERIITGTSGSPGGRLARLARRAADRVLDAGLARSAGRLDEIAAAPPARSVAVMSVYRRRPGTPLAAAVAELRGTRHAVRFALGSMEEALPELTTETVAVGLAAGKLENLNAMLEHAAGADWVLVADDDVALPERFLDRFVGIAEHLELALAQPAQSLASFAAWPQTRRRRGSLARRTRFVEIGPVTLFRRDAFEELTPFPPLRFGWGLDLHWAALAEERGWRLGVADAVPVRHEHAAVAASYGSEDAIEEARRFLAARPFVESGRAVETLHVHPLR
jgi:hypothetical protein